MAPVSNELFLLSCINNSNSGKIDFKKVAEECGMNTQGAASMRFRRFKEKHVPSLDGTTADGEGGEAATDGDAVETPKKKTPAKKTPTKKTPAKEGSAKKRKLSETGDSEATTVKAEKDDDES